MYRTKLAQSRSKTHQSIHLHTFTTKLVFIARCCPYRIHEACHPAAGNHGCASCVGVTYAGKGDGCHYGGSLSSYGHKGPVYHLLSDSFFSLSFVFVNQRIQRRKSSDHYSIDTCDYIFMHYAMLTVS